MPLVALILSLTSGFALMRYRLSPLTGGDVARRPDSVR